ncbi:MAG: CarD family transcriptional regulator [Clostridia bacterium]|nr:CarD family transcriptional regulator [Clostridia bacterium]
MNYNIGDYVVYPLHGAGIINGIVEKENDGELVSYYCLVFPYGNLQLMIPVDKAGEVGLRPIVSPEEIDRLLIYLRTSDVMPKEANWNKRQRENLERMKSGDIYSVADVYKFLAKREADKSLSSGEKKMLISARKVLFSEIQLVKGTSPEAIEAAVANAINGK